MQLGKRFNLHARAFKFMQRQRQRVAGLRTERAGVSKL